MFAVKIELARAFVMPPKADFDVSFDDPLLAARIEALAFTALDTLPYGVVQLDRNVRVQFLNRSEREFLGVATADVVNRDYFVSVAPDFGGPTVRGMIDNVTNAEPISLDIDTDAGSSRGWSPSAIRVRSSSQGGLWLFIRRSGSGRTDCAAGSSR